MIRIEEHRVIAQTSRLTAEFENGRLMSLTSALDGERYLYDPAHETRTYPVSVVYPMKRTADLGKPETVNIEYVPYNEHLVIIVMDGWFGHAELKIEEEPTGALCITPSVHTARPGVKGCRWDLFGIREDLLVTVPFMQGFRAPMEEPLLRNEVLQHLPYPSKWEAGFVAFGNDRGGFWIQSAESRNRFKYLHLGHKDTPYAIGLDSENTGPFEGRLSAGGVSWHLDVYAGDWTVPVCAYRDLLKTTPMWKKSEENKPAWFDDIRLAISWCPTNHEILHALKKKIDPHHVLIHVPHWREKKYDQCYPDFTPSADGIAFIKEGMELGYHMAPHCNSLEIDPSVDAFELVRDFRYRDADSHDAFGWGWNENGFVGVPEANISLRSNRRWNVMTKIHPALPAWQNLLAKNVKAAVDVLGTDTMFLDVSLCMWNVDMGYVNDAAPMEGMEMVFDLISRINGGLTLGGEGLDEALMFQHFAQGHSAFLEDGSSLPAEYYVPVNRILMGELCHIIGYHGSGAGQDLRDRNRGFIPTLFIGRPEALDDKASLEYSIIERALS